MAIRLELVDYIADAGTIPGAVDGKPWSITARAADIVAALIARADPDAFRRSGETCIHRDAHIEAGARLLGPVFVGPGCFIAASTLLRGGCWLQGGNTLGPGTEVKSSFLFRGATLAHFNFVGDSILGAAVNLEAGAVIANRRNERPDGAVFVRIGGRLVGVGDGKFGALIGDNVKIGANAVIAPGAVLTAGSIVDRLALIDQERETA